MCGKTPVIKSLMFGPMMALRDRMQRQGGVVDAWTRRGDTKRAEHEGKLIAAGVSGQTPSGMGYANLAKDMPVGFRPLMGAQRSMLRMGA